MVGAAVNMHHISFLNDDAEAQQRIIKHLIAPYAKGDFHQEYLHEHAGGRLSAFLKKDLIKIRPTNNSSLTVCAKLVSMIHDLPLVSEDPTIICQIDFANACDLLPHLPTLMNFFPYFSSIVSWTMKGPHITSQVQEAAFKETLSR